VRRNDKRGAGEGKEEERRKKDKSKRMKEKGKAGFLAPTNRGLEMTR
jgi:hypothetical protein